MSNNDYVKSEAFKLLQEMNLLIETKKKKLLKEGLTELEAEARLLYSREIQNRSRKKVIEGIEKNEYFIKN